MSLDRVTGALGVPSGADRRERDAEWWVRRIVVALALGVILGVATQRSTTLGAAADEAFATSTGPWTIAAALMGRWAPDVRTAVVTATVCLWSATIAFYAAGGPPGGGGTPGFWLVAIVVVGPVLGWLGRASAANGAAGSLAAGVVAGWLIGEVLHTAFASHGGHWHVISTSYRGAVHARVSFTSDGSSRWLSVAVNGVAAVCWVIAARGPRRVVAAALVPATAAAAVSLAAAGLVLGPTIR